MPLLQFAVRLAEHLDARMSAQRSAAA